MSIIIPHVIRPSVVDWNNTETLQSRLTLRRLNQPALTGESLCYGSGNAPTDELHGELDSVITLPQHPSRGAGVIGGIKSRTFSQG